MIPFINIGRYIKFFFVIALFSVSIGSIVIAHDITREEFDNVIKKVEKDITSLENRDVDWQGIISANTTAITSLQGTLNRLQDMLGNIFLLMLASVFSAIIGGSSLGYIIADRKRGEKQNE